MDKEKISQLAAAGIDVQEAMGRFMGNEALMMKFLLRFPQDQSFNELKRAMETKDAEQAYCAAHTLKGVAGNLAMKSLFDQACAVLADLREENMSGAEGKMEALERQYQGVLEALNSLD